RPLGVDEADVVLRILHRARHGGVARPRVAAALEVVGVGQQRDRYPHAGDPRGVGDFDLRDGLEAPPRVGFRRWLGGAHETRREAERGGGRRSERGLEKGATFHEISLGGIDAYCMVTVQTEGPNRTFRYETVGEGAKGDRRKGASGFGGRLSEGGAGGARSSPPAPPAPV